MLYYSTGNNAPQAGLGKAIVKGLAEDRGLYMPERIKRLPDEFFDKIGEYSFHEVALMAAEAFFGEDVDSESLERIVSDTLSFDCPIVNVEDNIWSLELFHGPTLAFKDVGARFMARLLSYFIDPSEGGTVHVLVATSGDTGSAVANGFLGVPGIHVHVLYPKGKVSPIQEAQFTTLGQNISAIAVDGVFDDCQALVKNAFMDEELNAHMRLTSANSINVARFLPQSFYYFWAYAQLKRMNKAENVVVCVPSGNFGNICSALFAKEMGLPIKRFIAANNANDVFYKYLQSGEYVPQASIATIANAMDVGNPSNFERILELYGGSWERIKQVVSGTVTTDDMIASTIRDCRRRTGYILDPHGACAYRSLREGLAEDEVGIFCETAHPAKFKDTVDGILGENIEVPAKLAAFMRGEKRIIGLPKDFDTFKNYLMAL